MKILPEGLTIPRYARNAAIKVRVSLAAAPWCVVRYRAPEEVLPAWFDHWTQALAMAIVRREGW